MPPRPATSMTSSGRGPPGYPSFFDARADEAASAASASASASSSSPTSTVSSFLSTTADRVLDAVRELALHAANGNSDDENASSSSSSALTSAAGGARYRRQITEPNSTAAALSLFGQRNDTGDDGGSSSSSSSSSLLLSAAPATVDAVVASSSSSSLLPSLAEQYGSANGNGFLASALEAFRQTLLECRTGALHYGTFDLPKLCTGKLQKIANAESDLILGPGGFEAVSSGRNFMNDHLDYTMSTPLIYGDFNGSDANSSSTIAPPIGAGDDLAFDHLYPAVIECFFVIICGYIAGKGNFISPFEAKGLNTFVGTFALPALIFTSMAQLNFSSVNWTFLLAISVSKAVVFLLVAVVTILVDRPVDFGKSGLFAIFCTQSNDFALGYPIIASLYRNTHPDFPSYLYLVAPISLVFLNPIGFVLMEFQKRRDQRRRGETDAAGQSAAALAAQIFAGVALNPVVLMTALGIVGNFVFSHCLPPILAGILKVLSSAYSATALFVLGLRLVGSLHQMKGPGLVVPAILMLTKGLVLPLITREIVDNLQPGANANETTAYSNYGFLYGTFPTAPTVFVYAAQYNIEVDMIASAMVIGTFLSALVMFVSARMVTLTDVLPQDYMAELNGFLFNVSVFGALACAAVVAIFCLTRKWNKMPHFVTLCLALSQLTACVGVLMWALIDSENSWKLYLQFFIFAWGVFSSRVWTALLAVTLVLVRIRPLSQNLKLRKYFPIIGWAIPGVIVASLLGIVAMDDSPESAEKGDPNFQYGSGQAVVAVVILVLSFLVTVSCLILQQRLNSRHGGGGGGLLSPFWSSQDAAAAGLSPFWYRELSTDGSVYSTTAASDSCSTTAGSELNDSFADLSTTSPVVARRPTSPAKLPTLTEDGGGVMEGKPSSTVSDTASMTSYSHVHTDGEAVSLNELNSSPIRRASLKTQLVAFQRYDDEKNAILFCPTDELNPPQTKAKTTKWKPASPRHNYNLEATPAPPGANLSSLFSPSRVTLASDRQDSTSSPYNPKRTTTTNLFGSDARFPSASSVTDDDEDVGGGGDGDGDGDAKADPFRFPTPASAVSTSPTGRRGAELVVRRRRQLLRQQHRDPLEPEETGIVRDRDDEYQMLRHVVLLLILSTSMLVGLSLCLWSLVVEGTTGIYIELVFLDVALNFGQGFFVFAIFGLDQKLVVAPLLKRWRQCYHGTTKLKPPPAEKLSPETLHICQQFVGYHMDKCVRDIVRDRRFRNKVYKQAFCGNELVDWLLIVGLAPDRAHAAKYGRHLVSGRVLKHYDDEHHFHDQSLFYTFCGPASPDASAPADVGALGPNQRERRDESDGLDGEHNLAAELDDEPSQHDYPNTSSFEIRTSGHGFRSSDPRAYSP